MPDYIHQSWPSWRYGPNGEAEVFSDDAAVPKGWLDHPDKFKAEAKAATIAVVGPQPDDIFDLDADGWPYDPALHASTQTKTTAGLWRMKVGVSRPAAKVLDL